DTSRSRSTGAWERRPRDDRSRRPSPASRSVGLSGGPDVRMAPGGGAGPRPPPGSGGGAGSGRIGPEPAARLLGGASSLEGRMLAAIGNEADTYQALVRGAGSPTLMKNLAKDCERCSRYGGSNLNLFAP